MLPDEKPCSDAQMPGGTCSPQKAVQCYGSLVGAIIQHHFKSARGGYYQLVALFVGVGTTILSTGNIIRIKHPIDGEGHVDILIHIRQIALWVMIFVQLIQ